MENFKLTYSNLIDEKTQNYVKDIMIENGVPKETADNFITIVQDYNSTVNMKYLLTSKPGFTTINSSQVRYPENYLDKQWFKHNKYYDFNCRITAFGLFKTHMDISGDCGLEIGMDLLCFEGNPLAKLYDINLKHYADYYASFFAKDNSDYTEYINAIVNGYQERKIFYKATKNISIINVFMTSAGIRPEQLEFLVGHAGVLINSKDGLLFIEKISPTMPYQVLKLKDKNELKYIFEKRFKYEPELYIMENNKPL